MFRPIWTLAKKPTAFGIGISSLLTFSSAMIYGGDFVLAGFALTVAAIWSSGCWLDSELLKKKKPVRPRNRVRDYDDQLKRFQRRRIEYRSWQFGGVIGTIVVLLSLFVFMHAKWEQKELDNLEGRLFPANDPTPNILCSKEPAPENSVKVFFGPFVAVLSKFPQTVISADGTPRLGVARNPDGSIGINAHIVSTDGRIIAELQNTQFIVNPNNVLRMERKDRSSLSIKDQFGKTVLEVRYLNPSAVLISAFVVYTKAGDMVDLAPPSTVGQMCFGDKDDPNKGDLDLSRANANNNSTNSSSPFQPQNPGAPAATIPPKTRLLAKPARSPASPLTITSEDRVSAETDSPYEIQLVLATTKELPGLSSLVLYFDGNITAWSWTSPDRNTRKTTDVNAPNNFTFPFADLKYGLAPRFDPAHPLVFLVWSKQRIVCTKVDTF
jgi:hypothetical protein